MRETKQLLFGAVQMSAMTVAKYLCGGSNRLMESAW
jgi:hypothetical protein